MESIKYLNSIIFIDNSLGPLAGDSPCTNCFAVATMVTRRHINGTRYVYCLSCYVLKFSWVPETKGCVRLPVSAFYLVVHLLTD
jgi:hypothetical protein